MKALITGCAGFIGSSLTDRLLDERCDVIGIDCFTDYYGRELKENNISNALKNKNFKFIENDIIEMDEYPDVDYVFHLAAQAGVRSSWGESFQIYTKYNIEVTQKLLEFYKDKKLKKFVYSSSSSVYGDSKLPMNEDSLLKPISPYGVSKLAAEHLCYLYWKNYSIPTISLRYFTVYGPRQRPDMAINKFVNAILNNREINVFGDGKQTRDFTFIEDVVMANILAAKSNINGEVFNIGGGNRISLNDLLKLIGQIAQKDVKIKYLQKEKGDVKDTLADDNKANTLLKWKPKVDIKKGLSTYLNWINDSN